MPISFTLTKTRETLEQQWAYLVKRGQDNQLFALRQFFIALLLCIGLYLLLYFFTAADELIVLKAMGMITIALVCAILAIRYLFHRLNNLKSNRQLKVFLNSINSNQLNYSVHIDEEKLIIVLAEQTYDLPWTEFTCFGIHNETLYVFNEVRRMNSLYWDQTEIGSEAFSALLELLQRKKIKQIF
jgi:hypothetical protein